MPGGRAAIGVSGPAERGVAMGEATQLVIISVAIGEGTLWWPRMVSRPGSAGAFSASYRHCPCSSDYTRPWTLGLKGSANAEPNEYTTRGRGVADAPARVAGR